MEPHAAELQQVPGRDMGLAHRTRAGLLPVLSAGLPVSVHAVHAEVQDPAGGWSLRLTIGSVVSLSFNVRNTFTFFRVISASPMTV